MVNAIINAVTTQLGTKFGSEYKYYPEDVKQNMYTPCFHIMTQLPHMRSRSPVLYDRTVPIIIHYFSDSKDKPKKDCYTVAEQLLECLEYLPLDSTLLRGEDIDFQVVDDVLQFFITYRFVTKRIIEESPMLETVETINKTN